MRLGGRVGRRLQPQLVEQSAEARAVLGAVDRLHRRAQQWNTGGRQPRRQLQRRLAAELDDDALGPLELDHAEHVVQGERLEVEAVRGVVVGRDRLRVAVDHHRVATGPAHRHRGVDAAVVELDPLSDPVRPRAQDDDARAVAAAHLVRRPALPARVVVGRLGLELGGAGVDRLEAPLEPLLGILSARERCHLRHEPGVDSGPTAELGLRVAAADRLEQDLVAVVRRRLEPRQQVVVAVEGRQHVELARSHRLHERLLEGAPDRHRLAHRLHRGVKLAVRARELLEREARPLHNHVVDGRLEAGRGLLRDVVVDLLEPVAHGQPGGDLGDREPGRLRRQRRRARHARVHLDDDDLLRLRVDRELDVRPTGLDADRADHLQRLVAELLIERVGEGLLRGDRHAVARVHAHRVDVLDRAHDHDVVAPVAHHLELELAPADDRLLDQHLSDRAGGEALRDDLPVLGLVPGDPAAGAAHGETRADDGRQADLRKRSLGFAHRLHRRAARHAEGRALHRRPEELAVLGPPDGVVVGADQLDAVLSERPVLGQLAGEVQRRAAAQRRQQRVGLLALDHLRHRGRRERLDVGARGELRVGHDRRRIRVDENDLVALLEQHLAGLRARVVELGGLPDHDRPRAQDEDAVDVVSTRQRVAPRSDRIDAGRRGGPVPPRGGTARSTPGRRGAPAPPPSGRRG